MQAMILAAGLGTRLRPYSLLRPKPLFPVLNRPLLLFAIEQLRQAGCGPIFINGFHLREQIGDLVHGEKDIILLTEEKLLGTGGGLRQALKLFSSDPVLVVNGDIFHSINLRLIAEQHAASRESSPVWLVLHNHKRFNSVAISKTNEIITFQKQSLTTEKERLLAFTGIHIIEPEILERIPPGIFFNIIDCYKGLIQDGVALCGMEVKGHFWTDIGTPEDYLGLHGKLLSGLNIKTDSSLIPSTIRSDTPFLLHDEAEVDPDVSFQDWVCIGAGAKVGKGADLRRVVVWDGAKISAGAMLRDTIVV